MGGEREVVKIHSPKIARHAKVGDQVLDERTLAKIEVDPMLLKRLTIGSWDTGLADICTFASAPIPAAFMVHDVLLLEIQVMYCLRSQITSG